MRVEKVYRQGMGLHWERPYAVETLTLSSAAVIGCVARPGDNSWSAGQNDSSFIEEAFCVLQLSVSAPWGHMQLLLCLQVQVCKHAIPEPSTCYPVSEHLAPTVVFTVRSTSPSVGRWSRLGWECKRDPRVEWIFGSHTLRNSLQLQQCRIQCIYLGWQPILTDSAQGSLYR